MSSLQYSLNLRSRGWPFDYGHCPMQQRASATGTGGNPVGGSARRTLHWERQCVPGCQQGMLLVHGIQQSEAQLGLKLVVESSAKYLEASDQFGPFYAGGPEVFTAFQNRISPAIMILQLMEDLATMMTGR